MRRTITRELAIRSTVLATTLIAAALALAPDRADAGLYKVVACSGNNGSIGASASATTPNLSLGDHCGSPAGDPPGGSAFLTIHENQPSGPMTQGAYAEFAWAAPAWTHFRQAGGYTRQQASFHAGWRARFVGTDLGGSTFLSLNQGLDVPDDGGVNRSVSSGFGPHLWPFSHLRDFRRFAFRMECVRAAGCDRTGLSEVDANGFVFLLSDDYPSQISVSNSATAFMSGQWVRGSQAAAWRVAEHGSGLRVMRVAVDGANDVLYDYAAFCDTQSTVSNGTSGRSFTPCAVNNSSFDVTREVATAAYPDGERTLSICAQDFGQHQGYYGTGGETCDRRTVRIDNTAPVAPSNLAASGRRGTFGATWVNPPQGGVAPVAASHYRLQQLSGGSFDSGVVRVPSAGQSLADRPAGTDGGYRLTLFVEDAAGNANPANAAAQTFTIDSTTPETSITEGPAQGSFTQSRNAALAYVSTDPNAIFECSLDSVPFTSCPGAGRSYSGLADGTHVFRVRAVNANGPDPTPAERAWTIDNVAPIASITSGPAEGGIVRPAAVEFEFSAGESPVSFECRIDGEPFGRCDSPESFPGLSDGTHQFAVAATDAAGNRGPAAVRSFVVDGTPPRATITAGPASGETLRTPFADISFTADEAGASFECRADSAPFSPCSSPWRVSGLSEGPHSVEIRSTDRAGNLGAPAARAFSVDTVAPSVSITGGPAEGETTGVSGATFSFASDDATATFRCRVDGGPRTGCSSPSGYPALSDGPHRFEVTADDPAGNASTPAFRRFTVDANGPTVRFTGGPSPGSTLAAALVSVPYTADEPGAAFGCSVDGASFASCTSPLELRNLADGPHVVAVRATDPAGNTGPTATLAFAVDTSPPRPPGFSQTPNDPTTDPTAVFKLTGEEGATFECRLDDGRWERCPVSLRFPGLGLGTHTLDVRQTDPAGNVSAATRFTWRIVEFTDPNDPQNCALQAFRVRATPLGLRIVMRSAVPRLVKVQVFRRTGPFAAQRRLSVYRKRSATKRTVRLVRAANFRSSRKVRAYISASGGSRAVTRIVPRVINEVRGCNEGGPVGARTEAGYVTRFTRRVTLGPPLQRAWRLAP